MAFVPARAEGPETLRIGDFSHGRLDGWKERIFAHRNQWRLMRENGRTFLRADSRASASAFYREIRVDLSRTPWLHWRWRVPATVGAAHEREKSGDDFAARIYVVVSGGLLFWRARALNYVWASHEPVGRAWPNPFTDHAMMVAVDSGNARAGHWREHRRNIREDFRRFFGRDITRTDGIAIMTDSDNTGGSARADYGDIWFSER